MLCKLSSVLYQYQVAPINARKYAWKETRPDSLEISSSGSTLASAPASAQQCTRALREQGGRGGWKAINNSWMNSQMEDQGTAHCMVISKLAFLRVFRAVNVSMASRYLLVSSSTWTSCCKGLTPDCIPDLSSSPTCLLRWAGLYQKFNTSLDPFTFRNLVRSQRSLTAFSHLILLSELGFWYVAYWHVRRSGT